MASEAATEFQTEPSHQHPNFTKLKEIWRPSVQLAANHFAGFKVWKMKLANRDIKGASGWKFTVHKLEMRGTV